MRLITAPDYPATFERPAVFLGGAITGAPDWQPVAADWLRGSFATCFNPRRAAGFVTPGHPDYLQHYQEQTTWEHRYILAADVVLFWLPKEALAITTRFEIGWLFGLRACAGSGTPRAFVVGIEEGTAYDTYYRVVLPVAGIPVHTTLYETCQQAASLLQSL